MKILYLKHLKESILLCCSIGFYTQAAVKPNILLLVSEDTGPQLGCYGDPFARTPYLDRLGKEGTIFSKAYVTQAGCSPSRASIFTGTYPHENGQIGLATHGLKLYDKNPFIFINALKESGYRTAILGKIHVNPESAFHLDERLEGDSFGKRNVQKVTSNAMKFIEESDKPFFLMVNYADTHRPYVKQGEGLPLNPYNKEDVDVLPYIGYSNEILKEETADYYNCIERLDEGIGLLLNKLKETKKFSNTVIFYLGDHGAEMLRGKMTSYEGGLHIPLIIQWNGKFKAGQRVEELVSGIDLAPTILELGGAKIPKSLNGKSLVPLLNGKQILWRKYLFAEYNLHSPHNLFPQRSVRDNKYKFILNLLPGEPYTGYYNIEFGTGHTGDYDKFYNDHKYNEEILKTAPKKVQTAYSLLRKAQEYELYDLENDPSEFNNLANNESYKNILERLKSELNSWRLQTKDPLLSDKNLSLLKKQVQDCFNSGVYVKKTGDEWTFYDDWKK
jgi:N-sulfoglucosamine sulfohydrolase